MEYNFLKLYGAPSTLRTKNKHIGVYDKKIGDGLFCSVPYISGQVITVFIGNYMSMEALTNTYLPPGYMIHISSEVILDCYSTKGWLCLASLSNSAKGCKVYLTGKNAIANSYIHIDGKCKVTLKALRNIQAFEEIICSYGMGYVFPTEEDIYFPEAEVQSLMSESSEGSEDE
jgi:hypothetical protein